MSDYRLTGTDTVIRAVDGANIPADEANTDRQKYLEWLSAGGVPDPYVPPADDVPTISKAQALLYLLTLGKTESDVLALIASIPDPQQRAVAEIEWSYRPTFRYDHPLFVQLGPAIGIEDMAQAFREASKL